MISSTRGEEFENGFGRQILGETWAGHYGTNHKMSTRHDVLDEAKDNPILRGVTNPWAQCGGYWTDPMPDSVVLTNSVPLVSMGKDAEPDKEKKPCPGSWVRTYKSKSGKEGRVFTTTSGASEDILDDDFRRLLINACLWAVGMEDKITADADIDFVGPYHPATFNFSGYRLGVKPQDLAGWDTPIMNPEKRSGNVLLVSLSRKQNRRKQNQRRKQKLATRRNKNRLLSLTLLLNFAA